jgi:hypothetical protein
MQALKIFIPGKFYDSQIYDGRLYLWSIDGSLILIDWNRLVDQIKIPQELQVALRFALQYGDDLYANLLMQDSEVRKLMKSKFQWLSELTVEITKKSFDDCIIAQQDSPSPFPHSDSAIHYKTLYVSGQSGVSTSKCQLQGRRNQSIKVAHKLFDLPALSISASHLTLAVAAGNEGLFDYSLISNSETKKYNEPRPLSKDHCNLARWLYPSIFGSSYFNEGYFADFKKTKRSKAESQQLARQLNLLEDVDGETTSSGSQQSESRYKKEVKAATNHKREFKGLISSDDIFGGRENDRVFTWGVQDKICLATKRSIQLVQYLPQSQRGEQIFEDIGSVAMKDLDSMNMDELSGEVISADSSFFGVVLEKETGLLVINSSLESSFLEGEPVNWRVFPSSRNYSNQLHVIYDDTLHIHSFNHDYFVDQSRKKLGINATSVKNK